VSDDAEAGQWTLNAIVSRRVRLSPDVTSPLAPRDGLGWRRFNRHCSVRFDVVRPT
jgi:hypothetical protein